ncbi:alpha/beta hydrolase [Actinomycetospora endophytica]|uniref:Alpha/beta hydrolase n=1 Tax=Actinomycetospora endophytica TaxID=2291215 RepID=A0ABS8PFS6_9PSEU|nr:alpha/beta hydrolase fold domain-containing protein [Actinomycetospora endophytica]MCD2195864.1 alpha/beta hydrolase [Actinomycetospora endophytica]
MTTPRQIVLEPAARDVLDATAKPPFRYGLGPAGARKVLDDLQAAPIDKAPVDEERVIVPAAVGDVRVRLVRPRGATAVLPVVVYAHGGGWILGNADTHDRLVRELAVGARAAVAFVEYTPSPEARYPVAIEQGYATAQWIALEGAGRGLAPSRMAVAGESVGQSPRCATTAPSTTSCCSTRCATPTPPARPSAEPPHSCATPSERKPRTGPTWKEH